MESEREKQPTTDEFLISTGNEDPTPADIYQKVRMLPIQKQYRTVKGKKTFGAAHEDHQIKAMTAPYAPGTYKEFADELLRNPILMSAMQRRDGSFLEDGYTIEMELSSDSDPQTGEILTDEQTKQKLSEFKTEYVDALNQIRTMCKDLKLKKVMKTSNIYELDQGRFVTYFQPPLTEITKEKQPLFLEVLPYEDISVPYIDTYTKQVVAVETTDKKVIGANSMVYGTRLGWGLRKASLGYGASFLEPVLTISKALDRLYNNDIPQAVINSYITKIIMTLKTVGSNPARQAKLDKLVDQLVKNTHRMAAAVSGDVTITPLPITANIAVIETLEKILVEVCLAVTGVPKSMINREHGLTRDIATIEIIQFLRFVRKEDEQHQAELYEDQFINPVFKKFIDDDNPAVRLVIRPKRSIDEIIDSLESKKEKEVQDENIVQEDSTASTFGAAASESKIKKKLLNSLNQQAKRLTE